MKTKYPILLAHGIVLKDFKRFKAFGKIEKVLKEEGYIVYTSLTDGFGTIENNASILKEQILEILTKHNVEKINIIAHSKGGLDSKYMIKELDMEDKVASLTTLSTPHKGSKIATNLLKLPKFMIKIIAWFINTFYKITGDKNPDCIKVAKQLSSVDSVENETINFSNKVYCQSYSSTMKKSKDDFVMGIPLIFSKYFEKGDTDGMVSKESSKFGEYKGDCIDDSISHSEIVDFMVKKKKKEKIYAFYKQICEDLAKRGF